MSDFLKCALIRAIKTVCQTAIATIGAATVISEVDWMMVMSASALAGLLSMLTSIATGLPEVDDFDEVAEDPDEEDFEDGE